MAKVKLKKYPAAPKNPTPKSVANYEKRVAKVRAYNSEAQKAESKLETIVSGVQKSGGKFQSKKKK